MRLSRLHRPFHSTHSLRPFFFCNATATTEIYTLSLHDALPISDQVGLAAFQPRQRRSCAQLVAQRDRSEEHTSELQSLRHLVCRLLLEKKKKKRRQRS